MLEPSHAVPCFGGMQRFVHTENIALYRKLILESDRDSSRDERRHKMLLTLLAEELAGAGPRLVFSVTVSVGCAGGPVCPSITGPMISLLLFDMRW
jgi:hypothetical protein